MTWTFTPLTLVSAVIVAGIWVSQILFLKRLERYILTEPEIIPQDEDDLTPQQIYNEGFE
jgi:hypothetical protein